MVKKETVVPITHVNGVDLAYEEYGDGFPLIWVQGQASKLIQQTACREFLRTKHGARSPLRQSGQ